MYVRLLGFVTFAALVAGYLGGPADTVAAAPGLQLPWPTGVSNRMNGIGHGYNCSTHDRLTESSPYNADHYALDFEFALDEPVSATAGGTVAIAWDVLCTSYREG